MRSRRRCLRHRSGLARARRACGMSRRRRRHRRAARLAPCCFLFAFAQGAGERARPSRAASRLLALQSLHPTHEIANDGVALIDPPLQVADLRGIGTRRFLRGRIRPCRCLRSGSRLPSQKREDTDDCREYVRAPHRSYALHLKSRGVGARDRQRAQRSRKGARPSRRAAPAVRRAV